MLLVVSHSIFYACGQAPAQTANDYIRPYTEAFQYGSNLGFYNNSWTDESLATIAQAAGAHSLRPTLPESFLETYGYNVRANTFNTYVNTLGMKEMTCFVEGPSPAHRDMTVYPTAPGPSKLFAHMYEPIWNTDGTVNQNNYYAYYLYRLLQIYGDKVRYWEVVNEPDFSYSGSIDDWTTRAPQPGELFNLHAPIFHYVRMLHISYEVIKKYHPEAYVTVGGVGYPQFVDALLRYTENPVDGSVTAQYPNKAGAYLDALSFHSYPTYSLHYWDTALNAFRYTRTSDYAASKVMADKQAMVDVMARYGYGTTYPAKQLLISETNVSRRTSGDRTGSDESQRNFGIKTLVLAQKNAITQLYYYALGEAVDAPAEGVSVSGNDEFGLMGLYQNLTTIAPGAERLTNLGQAFQTTSSLLYEARYDAARTAALALPSNIEGAAFNKNGTYYYVLWAKALVDDSEVASATYSFPTALNMTNVNRYEWNYSVTSVKTTQAARSISLTSSPAFFTEAPSGTVVTPPTQGSSSGCSGTGSLDREQWNNIWGSSVASIPLTTTATSNAPLTQFEASSATDYNYGARLRGYVCPPQSGSYTFFVTGDDQAELYLSTDADPVHAVRIASCSNWIASAHDFYRYASQQSAAITLQAGTRYYIEARHKQGWGPGYVAVAWRKPNGTTEEPIPGTALIPFSAAVIPPAAETTPANGCTGTGTLLREQWDNANGSTVASIPLTTAPTSSAPLTQFEASSTTAYNYGARLRGYVCPPQSGSYTFFVTGDDAAELWLSTDADPAHAVRIASCSGWISSIHDFYRYASQQSAAITLQAGTRYYIEARHKQGWGPGYVAVAWRKPNGTTEEPIPGTALIPYVATAARGVAGGSVATATAGAQSAQPVLNVFPNPFTKEATVQFSTAQSGKVELALYDLQGRLVSKFFATEAVAGVMQNARLDVPNLSNGVYLLKMTTPTRVLTQRVTHAGK
ncbi:hypothetical protein GCM10027345_40490 [Hymenobacter daeguensis]